MQVRRTQPAVAGFEAGGRGAQAKEYGQPLGAGKEKEFSHGASRKEHNPADA